MPEEKNVAQLIEAFLSAKEPEEIERLADELGETGDSRAVTALVYRIGDWIVQEDGDIEDAVCGALVKLKVMHKLGNLNFRWLPADYLTPDARELLTRQLQALPSKYAVGVPGGFPGA